MADYSNVDYAYLEASLCNTSGEVSLAERFRSLFTLKNVANDQSIDIIAKGKKKTKRLNTTILETNLLISLQ